MTLESRTTLTTEAGAPVPDNQHSQSAGPGGPLLLQDAWLTEKLARFNRERIPERIVHAKGSAAYGVFTVTHGMSAYTKAHFLGAAGRETEVFARFSTVAGELGSADAVRDPRGFALKFYTEEGNYDLTGNNTPIFFLRDPLKFPDFIHSQKRDPYTHVQEPDNVWDFFSLSPEATHMFTWLFGDRGIPASYREMNGYGSHTFQWVNAAGEAFWVKYHFLADLGVRCLTETEAGELVGRDRDSHHRDLLTSIDAGRLPSWTLKVQIMPAAEASTYRFNPFDLTKVWPHADYPLQEVGRLTLTRNPQNYFAEVEQAAFNPAHFVPGIGPSPDPMLQGRLFAYGDAHRYRLGINHGLLPVNAPRVPVAGYGRDGAMRFDGNSGRAKNYEPNSFAGPVQTDVPLAASIAVSGQTGTPGMVAHPEDDDFTQAGMLYRVMDEPARARLVAAIAGSLSQVSKQEIVDRSVAHFAAADPEYGARIEHAVKDRRS